MGSKLHILKMSWQGFDDYANMLAKKIKKSKVKISNIYGVPRGGLMVAVRLSHLLNKPLIIDWDIKHDDNTLVVDDCIDTGKTLAGPFCSGLNIAVLFYNPSASFEPKFYVSPKSSTMWIVFPWETK